MKTLYSWLQEEKDYTAWEAEETMIRCSNNMELPAEVLQDIKEYTRIFIRDYEENLLTE